MNRLEELRKELQKISNIVEKHDKVSKQSAISKEHIIAIRKGTRLIVNNQKNRESILTLIQLYRIEGKCQMLRLMEVI